jgi:hypothetical protein
MLAFRKNAARVAFCVLGAGGLYLAYLRATGKVCFPSWGPVAAPWGLGEADLVGALARFRVFGGDSAAFTLPGHAHV